MPEDYRLDGPVHLWFELSYSNYLVLPRSLMQAMPIEWQERMVACLDEMREACAPLNVNDNEACAELARAALGEEKVDG